MRKFFSSFVVTALFLMALNTAVFWGSGCTCSNNTSQPATEVEVSSAPPAPVVEDVPCSPGDGYVWISGAWVWSDRWVWASGHWDRPPRPGAVWVLPAMQCRMAGMYLFRVGGSEGASIGS